MTILAVNKLYEVSGGSIPANMKLPITFKGVSGTIKLYGSNNKPASLSEMITETIDDIDSDQIFKFESKITYFAMAGGTATEIIGTNDLSFRDIGSIS